MKLRELEDSVYRVGFIMKKDYGRKSHKLKDPLSSISILVGEISLWAIPAFVWIKKRISIKSLAMESSVLSSNYSRHSLFSSIRPAKDWTGTSYTILANFPGTKQKCLIFHIPIYSYIKWFSLNNL